jgi:hypothetical protein
VYEEAPELHFTKERQVRCRIVGFA